MLARFGATNRLTAIILAAAAVSLGACGSRDDAVESWAAAVRAGDVAAAAERTRPPLRVDLGSGPVELVTGRAIRFFHESLPCGATVEAQAGAGPYVVARLRLVETPLRRCGAAAGDEVLVAFAVRDGGLQAIRRLAP